MKLVFPSDGQDFENSNVDQRFGRCAYFVSYDTESKISEAVSNEQNYQAVQGAGIQSAAHVVHMNADVCLTGHCGPKAFKVFEAAKIKVVVGVKGKLKDVAERFEKGEFAYAKAADVEGHWV